MACCCNFITIGHPYLRRNIKSSVKGERNVEGHRNSSTPLRVWYFLGLIRYLLQVQSFCAVEEILFMFQVARSTLITTSIWFLDWFSRLFHHWLLFWPFQLGRRLFLSRCQQAKNRKLLNYSIFFDTIYVTLHLHKAMMLCLLQCMRMLRPESLWLLRLNKRWSSTRTSFLSTRKVFLFSRTFSEKRA